ncbi:MAG: M14 family zinc carboxypeptidase [Saprospiraceae bacterium]
MKNTVFFLFFLSHLYLFAQPVDLNPSRFAFDPQLTYEAGIQSPESYLGYAAGTRFTEYHRIVQYLTYLQSKTPDRMLIHEYGRTWEDRPLIQLVISSPENLARIDELRSRHLSLMQPGVSASRQGEDILQNDPVFTSFSYSIHGNEASSSEAAMQVAYRLTAVDDASTRELLRQSVIILYICINPDGRDRYVYWINSVGRSIPGINPNDLEHYAPWPNGRTNHYWFDLNRDWLWGVHPETRYLASNYQQWMPQVHVDYHEQGYNANYFTAPGATPRNQLLPNSYEAWSDTFGLANIDAFNQQGLMYFTRDRFDFFYPGYGSSYPSVMGAIGMLTEQGGIGAGRAVTTDDGYVLTFRQRIFDHYITSMATLFKAAAHRRELLEYSVASWQPASAKAKDKTYIIRQEQGGYLSDFLQVMALHQITVKKATANFSASNCLDYKTGQRTTQRFQAGDYLITTDQPRHLLIQSILERNMAIEDSVMYDIATWSAPLAYNLAACSCPELISDGAPVPAAEQQQTGAVITHAAHGQPPYAWVIDWQERHAPTTLAMLWEKGYRVRASVAAFTDGKTTFSPGSLIILRGRNLEKAEQIATDMEQIARQTGVPIHAMPTGRMQAGFDLASSRNRPVERPRIAMLVEPPFDTYTSGQVYFLFDQETKLPIDRIRTSVFEQTNLPKFGERYGYASIHDYDVLILPGGRNIDRLFWQDQRREILEWLEQGGTLIALEDAAAFFTEENKIGKIKVVRPAADTSEEAKTLAYIDQDSYRGLKRIPGSAMLTHIDTSHPLGYGVKPQVFGLKGNTFALEANAEWESVGRYEANADDLLIAGYASRENVEMLAGKTFAGVQPVGDGQIVYLVDNPHFRMFWRGHSRMLQNAAMLLPGF